MDIGPVEGALIFLLNEYIDFLGLKYTGFVNHIADVPKGEDALRNVLQKETNRLGEKLAKAKLLLEGLEKL